MHVGVLGQLHVQSNTAPYNINSDTKGTSMVHFKGQGRQPGWVGMGRMDMALCLVTFLGMQRPGNGKRQINIAHIRSSVGVISLCNQRVVLTRTR